MKEIMDHFEKKIAKYVKKAKKGKKKAKKAKDERYFEGQIDVLKHVLVDLKILRDEFTPASDEIAALTVEEETVEAAQAISASERLLHDALSKGFIIRKTSYYFHDSFPTGKAHGKRKTLELLENEDIAGTLQQQLAESVD